MTDTRRIRTLQSALERLEAKMQLEARAYLERQLGQTNAKKIEGASPNTATDSDLVRSLRTKLASERRKARNRHWSYDLNRHLALRQALNRALSAESKA